jgi:hypothetical protein
MVSCRVQRESDTRTLPLRDTGWSWIEAWCHSRDGAGGLSVHVTANGDGRRISAVPVEESRSVSTLKESEGWDKGLSQFRPSMCGDCLGPDSCQQFPLIDCEPIARRILRFQQFL